MRCFSETLTLVTLATLTSALSETYDYIIVGGGLTGLVVANRLSEDSNKTVLVIENGYIESSPNVQVPYLAGVLNRNPPLYQAIVSAPDPQLGNRTFPVAVGNVVGGGSIVNGMMLDRGSNADYNAWEELGNVGWGWKDLAPYFKKVFTFTPPSEETTKVIGITYDKSAYGNGPVQATIASFQYPDYKTIFDAWKNKSGIPLPREGFASPLGAFWAPNTVDNVTAERSNSRTAYYDPVKTRPNLKLLVGTHVDELLFDIDPNDGIPRAKGVKMTDRNTSTTTSAWASREVILAAGAIFTPHLLMVSGIGSSHDLKAANIPVKVDLPAVGSNLQDHIPAYMTFNLSNLAFPNYNTLATNTSFNASAAAEYASHRTGPWTLSRGNALALLTPPTRYATAPTLHAGYLRQRSILLKQFTAHPAYAAAAELPTQPSNRATAALPKPLSRGTITLNASDPAAYPLISYNSLKNPVHTAILTVPIRYNRAHWASPALAYVSDEEIVGALNAKGAVNPSFAHPVGSCAMMPRGLGGCVGEGLLVYGVGDLSVVDASVLPMIPAAHLQATMYAVAEKAADVIKRR
ncbi:GMC oxidoreductase [Karstenula rhodostoma CBS 690.94]|uniref:GMC oxidoreductase n=1 Tax=Karstenula rhodostoma CBS 690.94 TaxID=1392251 RepID=A0A9P4UDB8_9PLEO|nr:GMC oxidoreductase [Karstenula rhodostoma CBS 690.94]